MSDTFTDRYGTALQIGGEASFAGCARLTVSKLCGIHVDAAQLADRQPRAARETSLTPDLECGAIAVGEGVAHDAPP